jgi:hypothetical protein
MNGEIGAEAAQFPEKEYINGIAIAVVSFSDDEFVIGPCRSTATHDNDRK